MKAFAILLLLAFCCSQAQAGLRYTMRVGVNAGGKRTYVVQNSWLQDDKARLAFDETEDNYEYEATGFGAAVYSIDPVTHRTTRIDISRHQGPRDVVIENVSTTKVLEEAGPTLLGHPTIHLRYTSKFDYTEHGFSEPAVMEHDIWIAKDLADADMLKWMRFQAKLRDDVGIESLFREISAMAGGLTLAYDGIARIRSMDGNMRVMRVEANVESIESVNVDPSVFHATENTFEVTPK